MMAAKLDRGEPEKPVRGSDGTSPITLEFDTTRHRFRTVGGGVVAGIGVAVFGLVLVAGFPNSLWFSVPGLLICLLAFDGLVTPGRLFIGRVPRSVTVTAAGLAGEFKPTQSYELRADRYWIRSAVFRFRVGWLEKPNFLAWSPDKMVLVRRSHSKGGSARVLIRLLHGNNPFLSSLGFRVRASDIGPLVRTLLSAGAHVHVEHCLLPGWDGPMRACPSRPSARPDQAGICLPSDPGGGALESWLRTNSRV